MFQLNFFLIQEKTMQNLQHLIHYQWNINFKILLPSTYLISNIRYHFTYGKIKQTKSNVVN